LAAVRAPAPPRRFAAAFVYVGGSRSQDAQLAAQRLSAFSAKPGSTTRVGVMGGSLGHRGPTRTARASASRVVVRPERRGRVTRGTPTGRRQAAESAIPYARGDARFPARKMPGEGTSFESDKQPKSDGPTEHRREPPVCAFVPRHRSRRRPRRRGVMRANAHSCRT